MTAAHPHQPFGAAGRLIAMALLVGACGTVVDPITTLLPSPTAVRTTPTPSSGPFVKSAYPVDGDAPCGGANAPDASHAAYTGNIKRISASKATTVVFELCNPDVAFLSKLASPAFSINDSGWLKAHIDPTVTGLQAIVSEVNGTGPYRLERWTRGSEVRLARNDAYWGDPATNERVIVRWLDDATQRLKELQEGTVDGTDSLDPAGVGTANDDGALTLKTRPGLNVFYLGFNANVAPFDNEKVRQAIAIGVDRAHIVSTYFPAGSEVASHYTPCPIPFGCSGAPWYEYDPPQAKELMVAAGYPGGFDTTIRYLATARPYLPDPAGVASELQAELLANLRIRAELVAVPEETFIADLDAGTLDGIHLLGQTATFPDVTAFLDPRFGSGSSAEFGKPFPDIGAALASGDASAAANKRDAAYAKANDAIRAHVPMVPIARTGSAAAFRADVDGAGASPLHLERFAGMTPGDRRQFVWLTTAEPGGLYCADATDPVANLVCAQLMDTLYAYDPTGSGPVPSLARRCDPNTGLTVWTCALTPGVRFQDGSTVDASDVVLSFAVQWDAEHPLHKGRAGTFATFQSLFGGFLHPAARP